MLALAEEVGGRLRQGRYRAGLLEVSVRDAASLGWASRQTLLRRPADGTRELYRLAMDLFRQLHAWPAPLRGLGLRAGALASADAPEQMDMFTDHRRLDGQRRIDAAVDAIREKYGTRSIRYMGAALPEELPREKCSFADR